MKTIIDENYLNLLDSIICIQQDLLENPDLDIAIGSSFKHISEIIYVERFYIFENFVQNSTLYCSQIYEYNRVSDNSKVKNI